MAYLTEPRPDYGTALPAAPGIRRIVAPNPGPMTYHGTNTYLIDGAEGTIVLDPGPENAAHLDAVLKQAGHVAKILISHGHFDHVGGLPGLRAATGAPVFAFSDVPAPDHPVRDGDVIEGWTAIHTPGHAADHLCLAREDGVVFTADHVMGWSSSVVSPPQGDMAAYFASLQRLLAREDRLYLPGHGPAVTEPLAHTASLLNHRLAREGAVLAELQAGPQDVAGLVAALYVSLADHLRPAAGRSVLAHLLKLRDEGRVVQNGETWAIP
jgi:glyoxylase-like metal-dependent hydrolase (beta-lactamase superfamily II)